MEPDFPLEFIVYGTPVSHQSDSSSAKEAWKAKVKEASHSYLPEMHFATDRPLAITTYYFPEVRMQGDVDNIVKLTVDALNRHIYLDDNQIERIVVQKFEPERVFSFPSPGEILAACMLGAKPALYIRISDDPYEDLKG